MSDNMNKDEISTKEFLAKVEEAARSGAMKGSRGLGGHFSLYELIRTAILLVVIAAFAAAYLKMNNFVGKLGSLFSLEASVEGHDLTIENHGIFGYAAADFQEAILGDSEQLKKLEVYTVNVSEAVPLVNTGLAKIKAFTKTQLLTYKGTATYTVDLGELKKDDITLDEEGMTVHLRIPHAKLEPININENDIEFGNVERGLLGLGKMTMAPEEQARIQDEARIFSF